LAEIGEVDSNFGAAVAVSSNGNTALVGAPIWDYYDGRASVFTRSGEIWNQQAVLDTQPSLIESKWGKLVALADEGDTALVGSGIGRLSLQKRAESKWSPAVLPIPVEAQVPRVPFSPELGARLTSLAISADGETVLAGISGDTYVMNAMGEPALEAGHFVLAYTLSGSTWQEQTLTPTGAIGEPEFGSAVALSADGDTALIGGPADNAGIGAAWAFTRSGTTWNQQGEKLTANNETGAGEFGSSVALSADGSKALIGGPNDDAEAGAAWTFTRSGEAWTQQPSKLTASEGASGFGGSVNLSGEGNLAVIGGGGAFWTFGAEAEGERHRHHR
jgi:hypothetical protein